MWYYGYCKQSNGWKLLKDHNVLDCTAYCNRRIGCTAKITCKNCLKLGEVVEEKIEKNIRYVLFRKDIGKYYRNRSSFNRTDTCNWTSDILWLRLVYDNGYTKKIGSNNSQKQFDGSRYEIKMVTLSAEVSHYKKTEKIVLRVAGKEKNVV